MCSTPRLVAAAAAADSSIAVYDVERWNAERSSIEEEDNRSRMACSPEDRSREEGLEPESWAFVVPRAITTDQDGGESDAFIYSSLLERPLEELQILLHQESTAYPVCPNYLSNLGSAKLATLESGEEWRKKLCEWCFEVADHFEYDREVVAYALYYLDRTVALKTAAAQRATNGSERGISKRVLQLVAVTSLYLAVKLHGEMSDEGMATGGGRVVRRKLGIQVFVQLGRHFFTIQDIEGMERSILEALQWRMNPPTCLRFLHPLLDLCPAWEEGPLTPTTITRSSVLGGIYDVARYLTELSVCTSSLALDHAVSTTSVAAIFCAMEAVHPTLPLPADVRGAFLLRMAHATGLTASDNAVRLAHGRLQALCPNLFPHRRFPAPAAQGDESLPHVIVPSSPPTPRAVAAPSTTAGVVVAATTPSSLFGRNVSPVSVAQELMHTAASATSPPDDDDDDDRHQTHRNQASHRKRVRHS